MAQLARPLIINALKNVWNNLIDSNNAVNTQLVENIKDISGKEYDGTYTFSVTSIANEARAMLSLLRTGGGLFNSNMETITIWGIDKDCYDSLAQSVSINGGISLVTVGNILSEHCFKPGSSDEIYRNSIVGQVSVSYRVYKQESL